MSTHTEGKLEISGATVLWSREAHEVVGAVGATRPRHVQYESVSASSPDFLKACANAERMKACWNACLPCSTEFLESAPLPDIFRLISQQRDDMTQQRREALLMLIDVTDALQNMGDYWAYGMAKAEGAKPTEEDDKAVATIAAASADAVLRSRALLDRLLKEGAKG